MHEMPFCILYECVLCIVLCGNVSEINHVSFVHPCMLVCKYICVSVYVCVVCVYARVHKCVFTVCV